MATIAPSPLESSSELVNLNNLTIPTVTQGAFIIAPAALTSNGGFATPDLGRGLEINYASGLRPINTTVITDPSVAVGAANQYYAPQVALRAVTGAVARGSAYSVTAGFGLNPEPGLWKYVSLSTEMKLFGKRNGVWEVVPANADLSLYDKTVGGGRWDPMLLSELDDMLSDGVITQEQYDDAVDSGPVGYSAFYDDEY